MSRRTERVGNLIRNTLGPILLAKLSDPRFDPSTTSITRVEVPEDLLTAKVFVTIRGDEKRQNRTVSALRHAAGFLQARLARQTQLRHTPRLSFAVDTKYQKTMETLALISDVMEEIHEKDRQQEQQDSSQVGGEPTEPQSPSEGDAG